MRALMALSAVLLLASGCTHGSPSPTKPSPNPPSRRLAATKHVLPYLSTAPPPSAGSVNTKERHVPGDGFYSKSQQKCSEIPYPGAITFAYSAYQCWIGTWISRRLGTQADFYVLGFAPKSHRHRPVMLAGRANGRVSVVALRDGLGTPSMDNFGRDCVVVRYRHSHARSYYRPSRHRLVPYCRWRT